MKKRNIFIYFATGLLFAGCNYEGNKSGIHYFLDMHDSLAVEAQEEDPTTIHRQFEGTGLKGTTDIDSWGGPGSGVRVPPEGTIPVGHEPYPYASADFDGAAAGLTNPLPRTKQVLKRGKDRYNVYCAVCHGQLGLGDGPVTPRFPDIPAIAGQDSLVNNWEDGRLFHIITAGRARMSSYAAQLEPEDRWAIIHYIRVLQAR